MTFLDKARSEREEKGIIFVEDGLPINCPFNYGYEEDYNCVGTDCYLCWNREMPNTELVKTVTLPMPPNTEPKNEIDAADYINIYTEGHGKGYTEGLNDAWEFMKKWDNMTYEQSNKIFKSTSLCKVLEYTPQEALVKLKAYEDSKIEVGDVVLVHDEILGVVTYITNQNRIYGFDTLGMIIAEIPFSDCKKTGKHIEIKSFLEQIGE